MWYLTVSGMVFFYWLRLFIADKSTPKTDITSWLVLLIAPLLWPIVVPASVIELTTKSTSNLDEQTSDMYNNQLG